jgi:putative ABC transport system permease protein
LEWVEITGFQASRAGVSQEQLLSPALRRVGWRYFIRHPWQSALMMLGITLGVAVVVAIDLANASASRAFDLSATAISGKATHQIVAEPLGLPEAIYTRLRLAGTGLAFAPIIDEYVTSPQLGGTPIQLMGIDPLAEAPFRDYLGGNTASQSGDNQLAGFSGNDLVTFLTRPGALLISIDLADRYGLKTGDQLELQIAGKPKSAFIAGLLQPATASLSRRALAGLLLADIATAQELTDRLGRLDRIDLILPDGCQVAQTPCPEAEQILSMLSPGASLLPVAARQGTLAEMTNAFKVNLSALSLLALMVGLFLIYNTMSFSVVQRRQIFGTLRCLGVTRQEIFRLVLGETLFIGLSGTLLGLGLGVLLGQAAVRLVTRTINDLYFTVTVQGVQLAPISLIKGAFLGIFSPVATAALPAYEAASVLPRTALARASLELKSQRGINYIGGFGALLCLGGGGILLLSARNLILSFAGTLIVLIGFALLAPLFTRLSMEILSPLFGKYGGSLGRMIPRYVGQALSRTSVAIAALMVAIAVTIGVSLMIGSFRAAVVTWLGQTLQGDIYISAPGLTATRSSTTLDPQVVSTAAAWPGVSRADVLRSVTVDSPAGPINISASNNPHLAAERLYLAADSPAEAIQAALSAGYVMVSEPLANRLSIERRGGRIRLNTSTGLTTFPIVAIYHDYSSSQGTLLMDLKIYQKYWQDPALTAMALHLEPGLDPESVSSELAESLTNTQHLLVRPNQVLRQEVLAIFDQTFTITGALQLLATGVAFIGILSALLALQLERQSELGILRSIGLTIRQLWVMVLTETGLMGLVAGLLAMPAGLTLAMILIYIINRRSFGWTFQLHMVPLPFLQALAVAVLAGLIAGLYPAYRMSRMLAAEAVRFE